MSRQQRVAVERGVYRLVYREQPDRDGVYWFRFKPWGRDRPVGPFKTLAAARRARIEALAQYEQHKSVGHTNAATSAPMGQLVSDYLSELNGVITRAGFIDKQAYGAFWQQRFTGRRIRSLTPHDVRRAAAELKARPLANTTVTHCRKFLRAMMR